MLVADVILPLALQGTLTYLVPEALAPQIRVGQLAIVPVRRKHYTAVIAGLRTAGPVDAAAKEGENKSADRKNYPIGEKKLSADYEKLSADYGTGAAKAAKPKADALGQLRPLTSLVEPSPLVLPQQLRLWRWMAYYYLCSAGEVATAALPALLKDEEKAGRAVAKADKEAEALLSAPLKAVPPQLQHLLSPAQQRAAEGIRRAWAEGEGAPRPVLLHGVTSSGKTEVYVELIKEALQRGEQVLYLVPEIALTTQLTSRLGKVFGDRMGIWHSKFTALQRMKLWRRQLSDQALPLILGARSAVFLPWQKLGLVLVDEEHEASYKQADPAPRYNARDVAIMMAHLQNTGPAADRAPACRVLLGSATPSLESFTHARSGKYGYVSLAERYGGVEMPEIIVEDMKELRRKRLLTSPFSPRLTDETRTALADGMQAILFQNRRGYAPVITCRTCGWTPRCTRCDVNLTFHKAAAEAHIQAEGRLVCHYCGNSYPAPRQCPQCGDTDLRDVGYGTEKIEAAARSVFANSRILRMDLDTTRSRRSYEEIIQAFQTGNKNLLVGTQMVTKGLDFARVKIVGILSADQMLNQPDFRAYERSFQTLSQVAGRAGRRSGRGRVILQTAQPDLPVVRHVVESDYEGFYADEMEERRAFGFPPCTRLIYIYVKSPKDTVAETAARVMAELLRPHFAAGYVLGPERPFVQRVALQYIRRLLVKVDAAAHPSEVRRHLLAARQYLVGQPDLKGVNIYFDVDPI